MAIQPPPVPLVSGTAKKKTNPLAIGCLVILLVFYGFWILGRLAGGNSATSSHSSSDAPKLELVSSNWHIGYNYAIFEGQVKNISSQPLEGVTAAVSFFDDTGAFITSSDALIDYNPILPGQTSPFKVMKTENPAMRKANVEFKYLMGGTIAFTGRNSISAR
jgi:hypothetical protein